MSSLKRARENFHDLFEYSLDLIYVHDFKGNFVDANDIALDTLGYSRDEISEISFPKLIGKDQIRTVFEVLKQFKEKGRQSEPSEYKLKTKNGQEIYVETYGIPIKENGKTVGILGIAKDITERKLSDEKYKTLIDNLEYPVAILDIEGKYNFVSPAYCESFGKTEEELIGSNFKPIVHEVDKSLTVELIKKMFKPPYKAQYELRINTPKGLKWYLWLDKAIIGANNRLEGIISVGRDISETKIANMKLKESEKKLKELNAELERRIIKKEEDLQESEVKYRNILENSKDAIVTMNLNGDITFVAPQISTILGGRKIKSLQDAYKIIHPDDVKFLSKLLSKGISDKGITTQGELEFRAKHKDGQYIWVASSSKNYYDNEDNLIGFITVIRDITENKLAEKKLIESEKKYRLLLENMNDLIGVINKDFIIEYINEEAYIKQLGYKKEELIGDPLERFVYRDDIEKVLKGVKKIFEKGEGMMELRLNTKTGDYRWFQVLGKRFKDKDGKLKCQLISRDISKQKKAEKQLKYSEEKFRHLFERSPYSILLLNIEGEILDCNLLTEDFFSKDKKELIGKSFSKLGLPSLDELPLFKSSLDDVINGKIPEPLEAKIINTSGKEIWINIQESLLLMGNDINIQIIIQDITARKEAEEIVKNEVIRLRQIDEIKNEFVYRASHELKTPLNSINVASAILLKYYDEILNEKIKKLIVIINNGGERLKRLVEDLVDVSRIESRTITLYKEKKDLVLLVQQQLEDMVYLIKERDLEVEINFADTAIANIDPQKIEQVVINLLSNAIKNTPPQGKIKIEFEKKPPYLLLKFKDTGVGFTEKEKEKVFKRFGKIERYGKGLDINIEGSGLGLYISKEIIELHGGKIWVESEGRNKGSTFFIQLPIDTQK